MLDTVTNTCRLKNAFNIMTTLRLLTVCENMQLPCVYKLYLLCWVCMGCETGLECSRQCQQSLHLHTDYRPERFNVNLHLISAGGMCKYAERLEVCYDSQTTLPLPCYVRVCIRFCLWFLFPC